MIETLNVDIAVIGWGKGGKTLAAGLGKAGKKIAMIERSSMMAGGTCINIGCVPTKALVHQAEVAATLRKSGAIDSAEGLDAQFVKAVEARDGLIGKVRAVNHQMLDEVDSVVIVQGFAQFDDDQSGELKRIRVTGGEDELIVEAPVVIINTGSVPAFPGSIQGVDEVIREGGADIALEQQAEMATATRGIYTSTTLQHAHPRPENLVIVGAGVIALEFASMFAQFGSKVTVLNRSAQILSSEDAPVRDEVAAVLEGEGIEFVHNADIREVVGSRESGDLGVRIGVDGGERVVSADAVLLATGRVPATKGLGLEEAGIEVGRRGEVVVDEFLRASVPGVYAIGDVNGGPQQTFISLDDFRIVKDQLVGAGKRSVKDRVAVPATMFITPAFSQVGITEAEAREQGLDVKVAYKKVAAVKAMPRPKAMGDPRGIISFVVDSNSDLILGARLFHIDSQEVINLVALAMRAGVTASQLRDGIWTHPASTEALNEVLAELA